MVLPALNLTSLGAGILIMVQQVRMMTFSLNMCDYSVSFLSLSPKFFDGQVRGTILSKFYFLVFDVDPSFMLKSYDVWWVGGGWPTGGFGV